MRNYPEYKSLIHRLFAGELSGKEVREEAEKIRNRQLRLSFTTNLQTKETQDDTR